jgi:predicted transposase YbfD/YdcC
MQTATQSVKTHFLDYFSKLTDPRIERCKLHPVDEILLLTVSGIMCGAETWEDIEEFGLAKEELLKKLLPYKNGIPSDDTLRRFFRGIDYTQFQSCFIEWTQSLNVNISQGVIAIDGKTACGSKDGATKALHMVSAFTSETKIILGQEKVSGKSNEITAIPKLLELLDIRGGLVTIDALGCQTKIADKIIEKEADYLLAVKKNQEGMYDKINYFFESGLAKQAGKFENFILAEKNHGRIEERECRISNVDFIPDLFQGWKNTKSIISIRCNRTIKGASQTESRYYISSKTLTAKEALDSVRAHWSIENSLHWVLDVSFNEDASRIRYDNSPANMAIIRHVALNTMRQCKPKRIRSLKGFKKHLGWNNSALVEVLKNMGYPKRQ